MSHRYFALHKPYGMLAQFIGGHPKRSMLGELAYPFPEGTHALGRLDATSEGLLLLTTNKAITKLLFNPAAGHQRKYLVNVYRQVSDATIAALASGIEIKVADGALYSTKSAEVSRCARPEWLLRANHELREDIAQEWLELTLTEGKFRQVRKMLQAVRHPCHRLIRLSIDRLELGDLASGAVEEYEETTFFNLLGLPLNNK